MIFDGKSVMMETSHQTADDLVEYREYVMKLALKNKDAKSFSDWKIHRK